MRKKKTKFLAAAEKLRAELGSFSDGLLPPLIPLSKRYKVSAQTMLKALHFLRDAGILEIAQGKRIKIIGSQPAAALSAQQASPQGVIEKLYNKIKNQINENSLRKGQPLPKVKYYCYSEHISPNSVCEVLRRLQEEKLIHKAGKQWIAGLPAGAHIDGRRGLSQPTICILATTYTTWRHYCSNIHTHPFVYEFNRELDLAGACRTLVVSQPDDAMHLHVPVGIEETLSHIRSLGNRYAGLFIPYALEPFVDLRKWIAALATLGKPVVLFDHCDFRPTVGRTSAQYRKFYRLYCSEKDIATRALSKLHEAGHRRIGITDIMLHSGHRWVANRLDAVREAAKSFSPSITLIFEKQRRTLWRDHSFGYLQDYAIHKYMMTLREKIKRRHAAERNVKNIEQIIRRELARGIPCLNSLMHNDVTAIIGLNDWLAINFYFWFKELELEIPRHISLVSFDNTPPTQHYPISTVDFGFERLGFYAAHIFLNDIPVPADKEGRLRSVPRYIDRGSVAAPAGKSDRFSNFYD
jgi:DNA-binding LacI/PurR family transcriptional regulator/DNA-binding transcriptional regulator YhcF (GntR family)